MNTKKKILIIHPALAPYRVDFFNYLYKIYDAHLIFLRNNLYSIDFNQVNLKAQLKGSFKFLSEGINLKSIIVYRKGIIKSIKEIQPEIVVTHEYTLISLQVAIYNLFNKNFKQVIWTADNKTMLESLGYFNYLRKKTLLSLVDGISVYTEDVKEIMMAKFKLQSNVVGVFPNVQNELSLNRDLPEKIATVPSLIKYLLTQHVILYVGRLATVKNIPHLIKAFKLAEMKGLNAKLIIVGDGVLKENLLASVKGNNNIIMTGKVEGYELDFYYKVADLFVLPSLFEPFGAVVNESLIFGTPVFCSNKAGAKNLILPGVNGELIDPNHSPFTLSEMLVSFFENKQTVVKILDKKNLMLKSFSTYVSLWLPPKLRTN